MSNVLHRVFVYGTLKSGFPNHGLLQDKQNGIARLLYKAVTVDKYPLVVASSAMIPFLLDKPGYGNRISGEIYEVNDEMMAKLDELEDLNVLYSRLKINVKPYQETNNVQFNDEIDCNAYILQSFKEDLLQLPLLESYPMESTEDYIKGVDRSDEFQIAKEMKTE